jgi:ABC-type Fe2+-enterobactin transport system substrate-binding protein
LWESGSLVEMEERQAPVEEQLKASAAKSQGPREQLQKRELNRSARLREQRREQAQSALEQPGVAVERIPEVAERSQQMDRRARGRVAAGPGW